MASPRNQSDHEGEFLGHLSPGIAHDLKSLLTPVSTFLQLAKENPAVTPAMAELLPVAVRNLETVQAY
ncbi:MAG: hypothetical protein AB1813_22860, partial [Verrucomicrobiota bacterium]